jgi:hypothetical protein
MTREAVLGRASKKKRAARSGAKPAPKAEQLSLF